MSSLDVCATVAPEPSWRCNPLLSALQALRPPDPLHTAGSSLPHTKRAEHQYGDQAGLSEEETEQHLHNQVRSLRLPFLGFCSSLPLPSPPQAASPPTACSISQVEKSHSKDPCLLSVCLLPTYGCTH